MSQDKERDGADQARISADGKQFRLGKDTRLKSHIPAKLEIIQNVHAIFDRQDPIKNDWLR